MTRRVLASVFFTVAALALLVKAEGPTPSAKADNQPKAGAAATEGARPTLAGLYDKQQRMQADFKKIKNDLNLLANHLKASSKPEDKAQATKLQDALNETGEEIEKKFADLVKFLKDAKEEQGDVDKAVAKTNDLSTAIRRLVDLLEEDNRRKELKEQIAAAQRRLEEIKRLIREQENERTRTELNRADKKRLGEEQNKITQDTDRLAKGEAKSNKGGEGKNAAKTGEGKGEGKKGESKGEGKDDTKDPKAGDKGEKKPGEPKDPKEGPKGEGKQGDAKSGAPKDGQQGDAKSGAPKDGQQGDAKGAPKKGDPMKGDPKEASKSDSKGKSDGKGEGKPSDSKGQPSQGSPKSSQSPQQAGDSKSGGQQPQKPAGDQKKDDQPDFPGRKQVQEATEAQKKAENEIDKGNNDAAAKNQADAAQKLKEAQKKLEDLLRQLREEEIERILAGLQARCEKMLAMQKAVRDGTVGLAKTMKERSSSKIDEADAHRGIELSDDEHKIIIEASETLKTIREEGSAIAFPAVLEFAQQLMGNVKDRLKKTDAGATTVATEDEIIASLEEMIDALKKARKENGQSPPGQSGNNPNPQNQPLLQELQELKMIRNMQLRVNRMTETYGKEYKGEQAPPPEKATTDERERATMLKGQLKKLGEQQLTIEEVTNNLYKGKNK